MTEKIQLLHLEDDPLDAQLIQHKLDAEGLDCDITWVNNKQAFESALNQGTFDLLLSDFNLPDFDGMAALKYVRENQLILPVIIISGRLGEEEAVECLKAGATDYVLKQRLQRLGAAVRRALMEKVEQKARREAELELSRQHKFLRQVIDLDRNFIFAKDYEGRFTLANKSLAEAYGTIVENLLGKKDSDYNPNEGEVAQFRRHDCFVMDTLQEMFIPEECITDAAGNVRWLQSVKRPILSENGNAHMVLGISVDITERKKQELRLTRLNRMHSMLSAVNSAITRIGDRDALLKEACRIAVEEGGFKFAWCGFINTQTNILKPYIWMGEEHGMLEAFQLNLSDDHVGQGYQLKKGVDLKKPLSVNLKESNIIDHHNEGMKREVTLLQNGFKSFASLPLIIDEMLAGIMVMYSDEESTFDNDEMNLLGAMAEDISFALNFQEKQIALNYATQFDILTGLPNRQLFLERTELDIQSNVRTNSLLALVIIDIRHFGMINDSFGKAKGDQLLQMIVQRLSKDESVNVARIGGNSFAMTLSGLRNDADFVHALQKYLVTPFKVPFLINDQDLNVTTRSGISVFPADGREADVLIGNAEAALKKAKVSGVDYLFYTSDINARVGEQLLMETQLRRAIAEKQFVIYYQPKVAADTGYLVGFEALIRWISPDRGFVQPFEFISILEETGMILEVGKWLTREAATDYLRWKQLGLNPPPIAVNVSAIQLRDADFLDTIRGSLLGHLDGEFLESIEKASIDLEITESVMMENIDTFIPRLQLLKDEGFHISIDDFGTGYSSFSYLSKIPLNTIKIDRSFITDMNTSPDQRTIVSTIILLAHALKLKVIAEGVETAEQCAELKLMGCDELQGYFFGKPMPSSDVERLLKTNLEHPT